MKKQDKISLIKKYLDKKLSVDDQKKLQSLMLSGTISKEELNDFAIIIQLTKKMDKPEFKKDNQFFDKQKNILSKNKYKLNFRYIGRIAAVFILSLMAGVIIMYVFYSKNEQFVEVETKRGDKIHVTIPGNNHVWLNSRSSIKYAASFSGANRIIDLQGEAYFQFSDKIKTPIIIKCAQTQLICTNGSLNVHNDLIGKNIEIEVEKGWISLTHPEFGDQQFIIEEGFKGSINNLLPLWIEKNTNPNYLAWHTGILHFDNTTMLDVAKTLTEVYDININIKGDLKYCLFTKLFEDQSLEIILNEIQKILNTEIQHNDHSIIITGNPC